MLPGVVGQDVQKLRSKFCLQSMPLHPPCSSVVVVHRKCDFTKDSKVMQAYQSRIFPVFFILQLDELLCVVISQSTDAKVTEEMVPSN